MGWGAGGLDRGQLARAYWANSWENWRALGHGGGHDLFEVAESPDRTMLAVLPGPSLGWSPLVKCGPLPDTDPRAVPSAMAWLGARLRAGRPGPRVRLTFGLPAGDDASAAAWRRALRGMAFAPTGGERTVLAHPGLPAGSPDPAVRRLRPGDQAALDEAAAVNGRAFGSPQAVSRFFLRPEVQETYVLALGTRLACVGCRYRGGGVYGIYSLGTEPALQRRGLAGRLLSQLLSGAGWTVLDTMPANVPFYRKRGFQPVAVLEEWSGAFDPGSA